MGQEAIPSGVSSVRPASNHRLYKWEEEEAASLTISPFHGSKPNSPLSRAAPPPPPGPVLKSAWGDTFHRECQPQAFMLILGLTKKKQCSGSCHRSTSYMHSLIKMFQHVYPDRKPRALFNIVKKLKTKNMLKNTLLSTMVQLGRPVSLQLGRQHPCQPPAAH